MTPRFALLLLLTWVVGHVGSAVAQAPAAPPSAPSASAGAASTADPSIALHTTIGSADRLANLWTLRRTKLADGDVESAAEKLAQIDSVKRDRGIERLDSLAISLIREAELAAAQGKADIARDRLASAQLVAPGLPGIDDARARIALELQPWAIHRWLQYKVRGVLSALDDFQYRALLLADGVLTILIILVGVGLLFLLGQLLRYGANLYYDLGSAFPKVMRLALIAAGGLLLFLPFYFGFGPLVVLFPLAVLIWPYQSTHERVIALLFICLLGAAPWMLRMGDRLTEAGTGVTQALHALSLDPSDAHAFRVVKRTVVEDPRDWHAQAALGMAYKRRGDVARAVKMLTLAAEASEGAAAGSVQNNLGNAFFAAGRAADAQTAYQAAQQANPSAAQPHFNLHRLYRRMARKQQAAEALSAATQLDAEAVARWNQDDDLSLNRYVIDMRLPANLLTKRAFTDLLAPTPLATRAWVLIAGPLPELTAPIGASATLLAYLLLLSMRRRLRLTWPCARTGRPVQVFMIHGRPDATFDDEYVAVFVHNKPSDRRDRFALEARMARFASVKRWITRACGLIPGLVGMVRGRPIWGVFVAGLALFLGLRLAMPEGVLFEPITLTQSGSHWFVMVLLGLVWAYSMFKAWRLSAELA